MLGRYSYPKDFIDRRRMAMDTQVAAYDAVKESVPEPAAVAFEALYFGNLVMLLDYGFVHRLRGQEGKDGNPLNEVRMLADSILLNSGVLAGNSTIKYSPGEAVLGLEVGETIALTKADFLKLAGAFFDEMHAKFGQ